MTQRNHHRPISRRSALAWIFSGSATFAAGCASDGHLGFLGYTTAPNYDPSIRTVYVPIFKSKPFVTTPYREMEMKLTRAVIDSIESKTTMKVLSDPDGADSELQGTIVSLSKVLQNRTPFNEVREFALYLVVDLVWHDLRPGNEGRILTNPRKRDDAQPLIDFPFDAANPPAAPALDKPLPVRLATSGRGIPELGESNTSGLQMAMDRMAVKIVSAMEKPW